MYERAARHASVLAEHLATARKRERAAAARARRRARAAAKRREQEEEEDVAFVSSSSPSFEQVLESLRGQGLEQHQEGGEEEQLVFDDDEELESEQRARALLIQCFQFDAPLVRGMLPPPQGADPASDGRAAVAEAMRSASKAGVETWQVNMRVDERGVELRGCFKLDLFPADAAFSSSMVSSSSSSAAKTKEKKSKAKKMTMTSKKSASSPATAAEAAPDSPSAFERNSSSFSLSGDESDDSGALAAAA